MQNSSMSCVNPWTMRRRNSEYPKRSGEFRRIAGRGAELQFLCRKGCQDRGQLHTEDGSAFLPVVGKNLSAMLLNDAVANAAAHPSTFADQLGFIYTIETAI